MPAWFYAVGEERRGHFEQDAQMEESAAEARS
jgi:hypothetical protein